MLSTLRQTRFQAVLIILLALSPLVIVAGTNYIVDPLQIYRQQRWTEPRFWTEQRSQNAGKIRSYLAKDKYDSVILGNSVADNFRPSRVAEVLGWKKTMKLTIDGGQASEQSYLLEQALQNAPIRRVLWCFRASNFAGTKIDRWHPEKSMPFYLYTHWPFDDIPYLLSTDSFSFSQNLLLGKSKWIKDLDLLNYWQSKKHIVKQIRYNSEKSFKNLSKVRPDEANRLALNMSLDYPSAENNLIRLIKDHQNVEFLIVIAPMTRQSIASKNIYSLSRYLGIQNYLVKVTQGLPNVKIFGFDNVDAIVDNLANYRDDHHYHSGVNEYMLQALDRGNNRLTVDNIDDYISEVFNKLCRFEINSNFEDMIPLALPKENEALHKILATKSATNK